MRYLTVICMMLASISPAIAQTTHEETVVRAAYARLSYGARTGVLLRYAEDARVGHDETAADLKNDMDSQLAFQLRSFSVGNLADIADTRWDALVSKPQLDLIAVVFGYEKVPMKIGSIDPFSEMSFVTASWQRWEEYDADWSTPVKQAIAELPRDTGKPEVLYSRYAAYSVTASLAGRQRTYQAIFLFGRNPDGSEAVYFIDHILGMGVLDTATQRSLYPQPLLETYMRELPGIAQWISSAGVPSNAAAKDIVCNGITGVCGIPNPLLAKSLSVPIDPETRTFYQLFSSNAAKAATSTPSNESKEVTMPGNATSCSGYTASFPSTQVSAGTADHSSGSHSISQAFNGTCTYTSGGSQYCNSQCQINGTAGQSTQSETGKTVTGYCHVVGLNYSSGNGQATNGASSCTGAALYGGADECPTSLCDCTITVGITGIATGTGKNIWTANVPVPLTCNAESDPTHLSSISVTPANAGIYNVAGGDGAVTTQQFTAIGTYANGATNNLTNAVWTSSNTSIATVSSTGLAKATGTAAGTLTITASSGGTSGYATLSVSYNTDLGSGGGGGSECLDDGDCSDNECCYDGQCTACHEQGLGKKLQKAIDKADHRF
jgi:hypothetical protein